MKRSATWPVMALLIGVALSGVAMAASEAPARSHQVAPTYPPAALAAGFEGTVTLSASVLKDGTVGSVEVVDCDHPNLGFENAASNALEQWQFEPAMIDGEAVESVSLVRLHFRNPSRLRSDGFVGGGIVRTTTAVAPIGGTGKLSSGDGPRTLNDNTGKFAIQRRPPCSAMSNCMYDRRLLFSTGTPTPMMPSPLE